MGPTQPLKDTPRLIFVSVNRNIIAANIVLNKAMTDTTAQNAIKSPLRRAPTEIRQKIFEHASTSDCLIELRSWTPAPTAAAVSPMTDEEDFTMADSGITSPSPVFSLLVTCSEIYKETSLLPFINNVFHCTNTWDLDMILRRMTPSQRSAIRTFKIRYITAKNILWAGSGANAHPCRNSINAFSQLTGLERLIIADPNVCNEARQNKTEMKQLYKDFENWIDGVLEGVIVEMEDAMPRKQRTLKTKQTEKKKGGLMEAPYLTKKYKADGTGWKSWADETLGWKFGNVKVANGASGWEVIDLNSRAEEGEKDEKYDSFEDLQGLFD